MRIVCKIKSSIFALYQLITPFSSIMSCKQKIKDLFLKCDIFSTSEFLRYNDEPEYRTYTGAFCSFVTVMVFCGIFMSVMISTFAKTQIIWSLNTMDSGADEFSISTQIQGKNKFMFAVALSGIHRQDLNNNTLRKFDVIFMLRTKLNTETQPDKLITLQPCTLRHWNINEQFAKIYQRMNFSKMLCPPIGLQIPMQGKFSSQVFKYAQIRFVKCNATNDVNKTCMNQSEFQNKTYYFNLFVLNALINPESPEYISYYLEDRNYIQFTTSYSSLVNLFISNYEITTDQSITPIKEQRQQSGAVINSLGQVIPRQIDSATYASIVLRRASTRIVAMRSFKRIDDTLSYIGGLFGFALIFLLFMKEYTEYSYEIDASSHLYYQDHQKPIQSHKFNFFIFIGYLLYIILDIFGIKLNWQTMKSLDECRQQIQKQLDVRFLFERINFIQKSLNTLLSDDQTKLLHLSRRPTLKEASQLRQNYQLRKMMMEKDGQNEHQLTQNPLQNTTDNIQFSPKKKVSNKVHPDFGFNQIITLPVQKNIISKIKDHFQIARKNTMEGDQISKKIIEDLDPSIIKIIYEHHQQEENVSVQNIQQVSMEKLEKSEERQIQEEKIGQIVAQIIKNQQKSQILAQQKEGNQVFEFIN